MAEKRFLAALKQPVCDNCLGRLAGNLLSGMTNASRGRAIRTYAAFLLDAGEKIEFDHSNFHDMKMRNAKISGARKACSICDDFFSSKAADFMKKIQKKVGGLEYSSFLVGSMPTDGMMKAEEDMWNVVGLDGVEPIRAEINREVGKMVEAETGRKFDPKDPDIVLVLDMKKDEVQMQVKSLYVYGEYQKLKRGIPQTKWVCIKCNGKGCVECGGEGKRYKTSVQEIVGKPLEKMAEGKDNAFHGSGREDVDARCLGWRPFVLEVVKPKKRGIDLKKAAKAINKSGKVKVAVLRFATREDVRRVKQDLHDKTYSVDVDFEKDIDKKLLPSIKKLKGATIRQQTPNRVKHRRADILRKRGVREISYKVLGRRKMRVVVRGEAGLYIKELVSGDEGRTSPNIAELLNNKVKRIVLDVIKVWK